jgi:hypothetical protein
MVGIRYFGRGITCRFYSPPPISSRNLYLEVLFCKYLNFLSFFTRRVMCNYVSTLRYHQIMHGAWGQYRHSATQHANAIPDTVHFDVWRPEFWCQHIRSALIVQFWRVRLLLLIVSVAARVWQPVTSAKTNPVYRQCCFWASYPHVVLVTALLTCQLRILQTLHHIYVCLLTWSAWIAAGLSPTKLRTSL